MITPSDVDLLVDTRCRRGEGKERHTKLSTKLHVMGKPVLATAQRRLETECKASQRKHDVRRSK